MQAPDENQKTGGRRMLRWIQAVTIGRNPRLTAVRLCVIAILLVVVFKFVLIPARIYGESMLPNFREGQIEFINRLAYRWKDPGRGDVVGIWKAGHRVMLLKRIIGLPGETVEIRSGTVWIDGRPLEEPYLNAPVASWQMEPITLHDREYFVIGDNRSMPSRLHEFGIRERDRIAGKILKMP